MKVFNFHNEDNSYLLIYDDSSTFFNMLPLSYSYEIFSDYFAAIPLVSKKKSGKYHQYFFATTAPEKSSNIKTYFYFGVLSKMNKPTAINYDMITKAYYWAILKKKTT